MLEFRKYPPETPMEERKGEPVCVVAYPNPCGRAAVGEVWALPFCEAHGEEAHAAARLEAYEDAGRELEALTGRAYEALPVRNPLVREAIAAMRIPGMGLGYDHGEAIRAAYDLEAAATDPDTLAYDYGDALSADTHYDWRSQAREMVVGFMREAYEEGQPHLLRDLEPLREYESVQQELALRDMERRYVEPRRSEREERRKREAERDPSGKILGTVNAKLGGAIDLLDDVPPEAFGSEDDYFRAKGAIAEAGGLVVAAERRVSNRRTRPENARDGEAS